MIRIKRRQKTQYKINLTPLIDVVFQLLVFFLLTGTFSQLYEVKLSPIASHSASSPNPSPAPLLLTIKHHAITTINNSEYNYHDLEDFLRMSDNKRPVILQTIANTTVQDFLSVLTLTHKYGFAVTILREQT